MELGRDSDAIQFYEQAYAARPDDPQAIASLALAKTLSGQFNEAVELAQSALAASPAANFAIGYLLQAAARSDWAGDPETLIPADLVGSADADLGLAEFWRLRGMPNWPARAIEISRRHEDVSVFKRIKAQAVLELAAQNNVYLPGGTSPVSPEELNDAAEELKAVSEYYLRIGFEGKAATPTISNTAVILRYCERTSEAEDLLSRAIAAGVRDEALIRLFDLIQLLNGKRDAALGTLDSLSEDGEGMLLAAELVGEKNPREGLRRAKAIPVEALGQTHRLVRWQLAAELASRLGDAEEFEHALSELAYAGGSTVTIELLRLHDEQARGASEEAIGERAREIAEAIPADIDMATRVQIAQELRNFDRPLEASRLLEGHVDLRRMSPATALYLQSLAGARRDDAFRDALQQSAASVREAAEILWLVAAHAWNVGDLDVSLRAVDEFLLKAPKNFRARLHKIELLARQNKSVELEAELSKPVESLEGATLEQQLRIVSLLKNFGFSERAAAFAYRLFFLHRDDARTWLALSSAILFERTEEERRRWEMSTVAEGAAVDVSFDDGGTQFFVIETDQELLGLDLDAREPTHPLAITTMGKAAGDAITLDGSKIGRVSQIRHKYVARLHYVLTNFESRFPTVHGLRGIKFDPALPDGLDGIKAQLESRANWVREQTQLYRSANWPVAMLAIATGSNVIEAAAGVPGLGIKLNVAFGNEPERQQAARAVADNKRGGCVLDLWTYWTAYRLDALQIIEYLCGKIVVAQNSLDELRNYRATIAASLESGLKTMGIQNGQIQIVEASSEYVAAWLADIDGGIKWIEDHEAHRAIVATDNLPDVVREHIQTDQSHFFDEVILALHSGGMLISDDLPLRHVALSLGVKGAAWIHALSGMALRRKKIDIDIYVRWSAALINAGQSYLGISSEALIGALAKDEAGGRDSPGPEFISLASVLGGGTADIRSHIIAVLGCIKPIWTDPKFVWIRQQATSHLLRQLIHSRHADYAAILRAVLTYSADNPVLASYIVGWTKGHFVYSALI